MVLAVHLLIPCPSTLSPLPVPVGSLLHLAFMYGFVAFTLLVDRLPSCSEHMHVLDHWARLLSLVWCLIVFMDEDMVTHVLFVNTTGTISVLSNAGLPRCVQILDHVWVHWPKHLLAHLLVSCPKHLLLLQVPVGSLLHLALVNGFVAFGLLGDRLPGCS